MRVDAVAYEERARVPRVLAQHEVGVTQLREHAQGHVVQVPDRRRAHGERHRLPRVERLERDECRADEARRRPELGANDSNLVAHRLQPAQPTPW